MDGIRTFDPDKLSLRNLHHQFLAAVAPRPIAFASTIDADGKVNLSPFSYFNVFSTKPPVMIFSPARSGRDLSHKHTYENVLEVPEVCINMVNYDMVQQMSLSSTAYPKGVNEFDKAGFTALPSQQIRPPRVGESPVSFECRVDKVIELGQEGGSGNLVISRVLLIHVNEKYLDPEGQIDTCKLDLVGRMGGPWYTRASGSALFKVPKPLSSLGIGVDQLPSHVRLSKILTGNDLGILGNQKSIPDDSIIDQSKNQPEVRSILANEGLGREDRIEALHLLASRLLKEQKAEEALAVLFAYPG